VSTLYVSCQGLTTLPPRCRVPHEGSRVLAHVLLGVRVLLQRPVVSQIREEGQRIRGQRCPCRLSPVVFENDVEQQIPIDWTEGTVKLRH
jgi:hypothetical protein